MAEAKSTDTLYIGSYGEAAEPTIHVCRFDRSTGELTVFQKLAGIENASFLTVNPGGRLLYAVSETGETRGEPGGSVYALSIDSASGELEVMGDQLTHGEHPCYVSMSPDRQSLYVANYTGGNAAVYQLEASGQLGDSASSVIFGEGELGPRSDRQEKSHLHSIGPIPGTPYVYAADLGTDSVYIYRQSADARSLLKRSITRLEPGTGPRHAAFSLNSPYAYVLGELDGYVNVFHLNKEEGSLQQIQRILSLPEEFSGANLAADIHLSPDGRYLYVSNRGHDSIAVFAVNVEKGTLALVQHISTGGRAPRNFALSPDGSWLLAANQETDSVIVFSRNAETGELSPTASSLQVSKPVCLRFS